MWGADSGLDADGDEEFLGGSIGNRTTAEVGDFGADGDAELMNWADSNGNTAEDLGMCPAGVRRALGMAPTPPDSPAGMDAGQDLFG